MSISLDLRCDKCAFWVRAAPHLDSISYEKRKSTGGMCKRYPKAIDKREDNWCGEHSDVAVALQMRRRNLERL